MSILDDAAELESLLTDAEHLATTDPGEAISNRPCYLITPPAVDYPTKTVTWRVVALSSQQVGGLAAMVELEELVDHAATVLPLDAAEPATYPLSADYPNVPSYVLRFTGTT